MSKKVSTTHVMKIDEAAESALGAASPRPERTLLAGITSNAALPSAINV